MKNTTACAGPAERGQVAALPDAQPDRGHCGHGQDEQLRVPRRAAARAGLGQRTGREPLAGHGVQRPAGSKGIGTKAGQHRGHAGQRHRDLQVPEVAASDQVDRGHLAGAHIPVDKGAHRRGRGDPVGGEDPVQAGQHGDQNGGQRQQAPGSSRLLADRCDHVEAADRQYPEHRRDNDAVGAAGGRGRVERRRSEAAAHALCHDDDHRQRGHKGRLDDHGHAHHPRRDLHLAVGRGGHQDHHGQPAGHRGGEGGPEPHGGQQGVAEQPEHDRLQHAGEGVLSRLNPADPRATRRPHRLP